MVTSTHSEFTSRTAPILISVGNANATTGEISGWGCPICHALYQSDYAAAAACCAGVKNQRQRRADYLQKVLNRKLSEMERIEAELESLGVELEWER